MLVIALWQLAGSSGSRQSLFLPAPLAIGRAIYQLRSAARSGNLSASLMRIGVGWPLGTSGRHRGGLCHRLFTVARSIRYHLHLGIVSDSEDRAAALLILWLGIARAKIATIALECSFSTAISVYSGVDAVPRNLIDGQSFNVPSRPCARVIWPGALPAISGSASPPRSRWCSGQRREDIGASMNWRLRAAGRQLMQTDQLLAGVVILSLFRARGRKVDQSLGTGCCMT